MKRTRDADIVKQKKTLRARFKKLVRTVIVNQTWLSDEEEQGLSMNVKKNVAQMRQKRKPGILTMTEKSLMRSDPRTRTIEERKKLCVLIAGLNCFASIPPKIRARMVPVLEFLSVSTSRCIIQEDDMPISVYFILNGEVEMKKTVYNKTTKQMTVVTEAIFGPGDCFGDVEMVEECPRMNTYVALSNCELLCLHDLDYANILKPFNLKLWNDKKTALKAFDYFDFLNKEQIILACKYAHVVQYEPLETIYVGNKDPMGYVRFVLSGECVILQCLSMRVRKHADGDTFELAEINKDGDGRDVFQSSRQPSVNASYVDINDILASTSSEGENEAGKKKQQAMRKMGLMEIEKYCGLRGSPTPKKSKAKRTMATTIFRKTQQTVSMRTDTLMGDDEGEEMMEEGGFYETDLDFYETGSDETMSQESINAPRPLAKQESSDSSEDVETKSDTGSEIFEVSRHSLGMAESSQRELLPIETHFIDVGSLTFGSIFGLGEIMEHRVIMARTVVQCLLLPRFWLFEEEQNPGNIWQRRRFYFECNVPSREDLFTNFLKTRKWNKFRHDYIQGVLNQNTIGNMTKEEDIPIMCRIVETSDDV